MWKICAKFAPMDLREDQKERRCHDNRETVELINSDSAVLDALVTNDDSWIYCYDPETKRERERERERERVSSGSMLALPDQRRPDRANPPTKFDDDFFDSTGMMYMHWVPTGEKVNKKYFVGVLREFRKRFRRKSPAVLKSGKWHFHRDNSILVTDYLKMMSMKTVPHPPYSPELAPWDFW